MMCMVALSAIGYRAVADQPDPYWENPEMFAENKLPAKATFLPYLTTEAATLRGESELVMDISGEWRFNWTKTPAERPEGFWAEGYDDSAWTTIKVPGN